MRIVKRLFFLALSFGLLWSFMFAGFLTSIQDIEVSDQKAEGIVVLTGGPGRIDEAFVALAEGRGERLLISGLNQNIDNAIVLKDIGQDEDLIACCVDAEDISHNTLSNAEEALEWAESHGYQSIVLITADYHMPRAIHSFCKYNPKIEVIPHPVKAPVKPLTLAMEFNKYLLSLVRINLKT